MWSDTIHPVNWIELYSEIGNQTLFLPCFVSRIFPCLPEPLGSGLSVTLYVQTELCILSPGGNGHTRSRFYSRMHCNCSCWKVSVYPDFHLMHMKMYGLGCPSPHCHHAGSFYVKALKIRHGKASCGPQDIKKSIAAFQASVGGGTKAVWGGTASYTIWEAAIPAAHVLDLLQRTPCWAVAVCTDTYMYPWTSSEMGQSLY